MAVNILVLDCPKVLQSLKDINLVFAVHQINRLADKRFCKLLVIREAGAFLFGQERILKFFNIVCLRTIIAHDFPMQHQKDFI